MPELKFSKSHEWVRIDADIATVGISAYKVTVNTKVTLTATLNGVSKSVVLTVTP